MSANQPSCKACLQIEGVQVGRMLGAKKFRDWEGWPKYYNKTTCSLSEGRYKILEGKWIWVPFFKRARALEVWYVGDLQSKACRV